MEIFKHARKRTEFTQGLHLRFAMHQIEMSVSIAFVSFPWNSCSISSSLVLSPTVFKMISNVKLNKLVFNCIIIVFSADQRCRAAEWKVISLLWLGLLNSYVDKDERPVIITRLHSVSLPKGAASIASWGKYRLSLMQRLRRDTEKQDKQIVCETNTT